MQASYFHPEQAKLPAAHVKEHSSPASKRSDRRFTWRQHIEAKKNTPKAISQQPAMAYQRSVPPLALNIKSCYITWYLKLYGCTAPSYGGQPAIAILT